MATSLGQIWLAVKMAHWRPRGRSLPSIILERSLRAACLPGRFSGLQRVHVREHERACRAATPAPERWSARRDRNSCTEGGGPQFPDVHIAPIGIMTDRALHGGAGDRAITSIPPR